MVLIIEHSRFGGMSGSIIGAIVRIPDKESDMGVLKIQSCFGQNVCQVEKSNTDSICGKSTAGKKSSQTQAAFEVSSHTHHERYTVKWKWI